MDITYTSTKCLTNRQHNKSDSAGKMDTFSKTMRMLPVLFLALIATKTIYGNDFYCKVGWAMNEDYCKLLKFELAMENVLSVYRAQNNVPDISPASPISSHSRTVGLVQKIAKLVCGFGEILVGKWNCINPDTEQKVYVPSQPSIVVVPQHQTSPTLQPCPPTYQPPYQPQNRPPYQPQYEPQHQPPCQPQYETQYEPPYQPQYEPQYQPPYQPPNELPPTCTEVLPSGLCGVYVEKKIFPTVGKSELLTMAMEMLSALKKKGSEKKKNKIIQAHLEAIITQALRGGVHESGINPDDLVDKLNSQCGIFGCIYKCSNKKNCSLEKLISG